MSLDQTSACEKDWGLKVEALFEVAWSVHDLLGLSPLGVAFGALVVKEGVDSIVPQARLALGDKTRNIYMPLLLRKTGVSAETFYRQYSFEVVICVRFFGLMVAVLS